MATIKCTNCNLVNFSTEPVCKRCGGPLGNATPTSVIDVSATSFGDNRPQQPVQSRQTDYRPVGATHAAPNHGFGSHQYQEPPPPAYYAGQYAQPVQSCMKCGTTAQTSVKTVKKDKVPPLAFLALFLGLLPGLIILLITRKTHLLKVPFCDDCYGRFKSVSTVETLTGLGLIFGLIATFVAFAVSESIVVFVIFAGIVAIGCYFGFSFSRRNDLKFVKITRKEVIVRDPVRGDVALV